LKSENNHAIAVSMEVILTKKFYRKLNYLR